MMTHTTTQTTITLEAAELATLFAALALYQQARAPLGGTIPPSLLEIATDGGDVRPLTHQETAELADKLQLCDTVEMNTLHDVAQGEIPASAMVIQAVSHPHCIPISDERGELLYHVPARLTISATTADEATQKAQGKLAYVNEHGNDDEAMVSYGVGATA